MPKPVKAWKGEYTDGTGKVRAAWYILCDNNEWAVVQQAIVHTPGRSIAKQQTLSVGMWAYSIRHRIQEIQKRPPDWVAPRPVQEIMQEIVEIRDRHEQNKQCTCGGTAANTTHSDWCDIK